MRTGHLGVTFWAALFGIAVGVAIYVVLFWRSGTAPTAVSASTPSTVVRIDPAPDGIGDGVELPPLDRSDALVSRLVEQMSSSPAVMTWLATEGLIRNVTLIAVNLADGATPARQLPALRPLSAFRTAERDGIRCVDPRSYQRYDGIAEAIASIDPTRAAELYSTLKPRFIEAHRDLGSPNASFDRTLERAIVVLLQTPIVEDPVRLTPRGSRYAFADERLESLPPAQRLLLRMGPRNLRIVKSRLRKLGIALGIRPTRLPG